MYIERQLEKKFIAINEEYACVLLTTMIGYVLSRPNYKLKGFFTWMVFIPMTALEIELLFGASVTGGAWLSSARVVRCWVKSRNERNPYP